MPYSRLFYHFVWAPKERLPLINERNRKLLDTALTAKVKELKGITHAINSMADHVHLVVTVPPALSLSTFIGQIKGSSSHLASHLKADSATFAWQAEYGVMSISESDLPAVIRYVHLQQHHHATNTLDPKLENCR